MTEKKTLDSVADADVHTPWAIKAVEAGLARFVSKKANGEAVSVTVKNVPNKGDTVFVPFNKVEFVLDTPEAAARLWTLIEANKGTVKNDDGDEVPADNPVAGLLDYAYGLQRRSKIRVQYESQFVDPEAADKRLAALLMKQGRFKSEAKALAAAKLMREAAEAEDDEDEDTPDA